jgi:hypothetical protein
VSLVSLASAANTVQNTILVFARDTASGYSGTSGLNGYGIPYQLVIVPQAGITLPVLNSTATNGNYGGIIVLSEVAYSYTAGMYSPRFPTGISRLSPHSNQKIRVGLRAHGRSMGFALCIPDLFRSQNGSFGRLPRH